MARRRLIPAHPGAAALLGAVALGVPAWAGFASLQPSLNRGRPADGFGGASDAGDLFLVVLAAAVIGALTLFICATRRAGLEPHQARAIGLYATVFLPFTLVLSAVFLFAAGPGMVPAVALVGVPLALQAAWMLAR